MARLAIASRSFSQPSETFIRSHVRHIAPNDTALICSDESGYAFDGHPVLTGVDLGGNYVVKPTWWETKLYALEIEDAKRRENGVMEAAFNHRVARFLRRNKVKVLMAEYGVLGLKLMEVRERWNGRFFVHFHGYDASRLLNDERYLARYRLLADRIDGAIAPSNFLAQNLVRAGFAPNKTFVSPCGVDPLQFQPNSARRNHVLMVGRLVEKKGPELSIQAFAAATRSFDDWVLDVVGDGPKLEECKSLAAMLGIADKVTFHGSCSHEYVRMRMQSARIFLQHSVTAANGDTEGMPVAILEAMATEMAVVSTLHSGIPEAVQHDKTGLLVAERDVDGMALALTELMRSPAKISDFGRAGRERIKAEYSVDVMTRKLRNILFA